MNKKVSLSTVSLLVSMAFSGALAANEEETFELFTLKKAAQQAIQTNPKVNERWHAFRAAQYGIDAAKSGYLPTVDVNASVAWEDRDFGINDDYVRNSANLTLSQMVYDGFRTASEVRQFKEEQLVRYYEMLGAAEEIAKETAVAFLDVLKYRELVKLAEENLQTHIDVFRQIEQSVNAGVARAADLEQINGRLSLSESNLMNEVANLHDVSARYLRLVGELPKDDMAPVILPETLMPETVFSALNTAYQYSPKFYAALYNIRAQEANVKKQKAAYHPKVNFTARYGIQDRDNLGFDNSQTDARVALEFTYNLYRGGYDEALKKEAYEQINQAKDLRDEACIELRQLLQISYNDIRKLDEQLPILNQHRISSDRVKTAYMDQFDIGQRTLLDVLDSENEYFESSRAYISATYDRNASLVSTLANMGQLLNALGITRTSIPKLDSLTESPVRVDASSACPAYDVREAISNQITYDKDDDMDSVTNPWDVCPNTDASAQVDAKGCAMFNETPVTMQLNVMFSKDSAKIDPAFMAEIEKVADFLKQYPETNIEIHGHSSLEGPESYNLALSERRAKSVAAALNQDFGIDSSRVSTFGHGETRPLINEESPEANVQNRRIEATVVAQIKEPVPKTNEGMLIPDDF